MVLKKRYRFEYNKESSAQIKQGIYECELSNQSTFAGFYSMTQVWGLLEFLSLILFEAIAKFMQRKQVCFRVRRTLRRGHCLIWKQAKYLHRRCHQRLHRRIHDRQPLWLLRFACRTIPWIYWSLRRGLFRNRTSGPSRSLQLSVIRELTCTLLRHRP